MRKDGSEFWAHAILSALPKNGGREHGYVKITRDMTARRRLEELEASSRHMNEFLALLGHELRNPLAPIRNAVSILKLKASDDAEVIRSRQIVDRQLAHLTKLVDDLLEASRVSSGKIRLSTDIVDIADIVHLSIEASQPLFDERAQRMVVRDSGQRLFVNGDSTRLVQALNNLLNNASKFSPPLSTITLEIGPRGGSVMLRVIDRGRGISADALAIVFDLFVQEHPPGAHLDEGGLGIGLTLVRAIAELHGGHVEAKSSGEGKGSTFTLWLPLAQPPTQGIALPTTPHEAANRQLDVLVVDDNRDSADSMTLLVDLLGHAARAAYNGPSALRESAQEWAGLDPSTATRADAERALLDWHAADFENACTERGLVVTMLRSFAQWDATPQGRAIAAQPLMTITRIGASDAAPPLALPPLAADTCPLDGMRVLDFTRILAGPVGRRALAAFGADVMLVNSPHLPNIPAIADTSRGKRSAHLDLRADADRDTLWHLIDDAHVFSQGYRLGGLTALGFEPRRTSRSGGRASCTRR